MLENRYKSCHERGGGWRCPGGASLEHSRGDQPASGDSQYGMEDLPPRKKNMFMFWPRHIIIMAVGQSSDCRIRHVGLCLSVVIINIYQTWSDFDMSATGHIFLCFLSCCEAETISLTTTHVSGSKTGLDSQEKGWIWGEFTWIYHVLPYFTIFCHPVNYYCYGNWQPMSFDMDMVELWPGLSERQEIRKQMGQMGKDRSVPFQSHHLRIASDGNPMVYFSYIATNQYSKFFNPWIFLQIFGQKRAPFQTGLMIPGDCHTFVLRAELADLAFDTSCVFFDARCCRPKKTP